MQSLGFQDCLVTSREAEEGNCTYSNQFQRGNNQPEQPKQQDNYMDLTEIEMERSSQVLGIFVGFSNARHEYDIKLHKNPCMKSYNEDHKEENSGNDNK